MTEISDSQPRLYARLVPELFAAKIPEETKATCSSCAMCETTCSSSVLETDGVEGFFKPDVKCCTYHPSLPNYLVGSILTEVDGTGAVGRRRVEDKIDLRIGVTPYGVSAPAKYSLLYKNTRGFFGRSRSMRCPYYIDEGGLCSIWAHREAVCSTYFCKHVAGADGRRFWMSLKAYLALLEQQLSRYAIFQLYPEYLLEDRHPGEPPERRLEAQELEDDSASEAQHRRIWGSWAGLEREFFEECRNLVQRLGPQDIEKITGLDGTVAQSRLRSHLESMVTPKLPEKVKLNPEVTVRWLKGEVVLGAYSELDALALPIEAWQRLQEFRGDRSVAEVRKSLRDERQTDFSDELLLSFHQHRILVTP